jgi:uncharacterized cupin superfamily protein
VTDVTAKQFAAMESALSGTYTRVRAELGVRAFGLQLFDLPPGFDEAWTAHAHAGMPPERAFMNTDQEEVYVPLAGHGTLIAGDERWELVPGMAVRVGPAQLRQVVAGDEGLRYLAIGGTPDRAYEPPPFTERGAGDVPPALAARRATRT